MILKHCLAYSKHLEIPVRCQPGKSGQCSLVSSGRYFLIDLPERMQFFALLYQCNPSTFGSPTSLKDNRLLP